MYVFRLAKLDDLDEIIAMVQERMNWFLERNILQWKLYLVHHPVGEWKKAIEDKQLYVEIFQDKIIGCVQFQYYDPNYWDDSYQLYIKKLCTKVGFKKVGHYLIEQAVLLAKKKNISKIRLDCLSSNKKLNQIYEDYGFHLVKSGIYDKYYYPFNLREMDLK